MWKKAKYVVIIKIILIIVLSILCYCVKLHYDSIQPSLNYDTYHFSITPNNHILTEMDNINFDYDFLKKNGTLNFTTHYDYNNLSNYSIQIQLPEEVLISSLSLNNNEIPHNLVLRNDMNPYNHYFVEFRGKNINELKIDMNLNGSMLPNGNFKFKFNSKKAYMPHPEMIFLDIEGYLCNYNCIKEIMNVDIASYNNKITISQPFDYYEGTKKEFKSLEMKFDLNMHDKNKEQKKNFWYAILIGIFLVIVARIIDLIEYRFIGMYKNKLNIKMKKNRNNFKKDKGEKI